MVPYSPESWAKKKANDSENPNQLKRVNKDDKHSSKGSSRGDTARFAKNELNPITHDKEKSYLDDSFASLYDENIKRTQNEVLSQCSFATDQQ